jgi:hypothetical protein
MQGVVGAENLEFRVQAEEGLDQIVLLPVGPENVHQHPGVVEWTVEVMDVHDYSWGN